MLLREYLDHPLVSCAQKFRVKIVPLPQLPTLQSDDMVGLKDRDSNIYCRHDHGFTVRALWSVYLSLHQLGVDFLYISLEAIGIARKTFY